MEEPTSFREQKFPDFEPPQACVQRIIKAALPENCQITKESKVRWTAFKRAMMLGQDSHLCSVAFPVCWLPTTLQAAFSKAAGIFMIYLTTW